MSLVILIIVVGLVLPSWLSFVRHRKVLRKFWGEPTKTSLKRRVGDDHDA